MARKRAAGGSSSPRRARVRRPINGRGWLRVLGICAAVGIGGSFFGYLLASRVVFPAPETPRDLMVVPDLLGAPMDLAGELLVEGGLIVADIDSVSHPSIPAGMVLGQIPVPGQLARAGVGIRLTVSRGPEMAPVPELSRLSSDRAVALVEVAGFTVRIDSTDSRMAKGTVVTVEPAPGTVLPLPSELVLEVSRGPNQVEMPLILGMQRSEAEVLLDSLGFDRGETQTRFNFGMDQGLVVEQMPPAGTMLEPGAAVTIIAGRRGRGGVL